jgi:hypothetical protein
MKAELCIHFDRSFSDAFDVTRDQSVSSNDRCRSAKGRMVAESFPWEDLHA